MVDFSFLGTNEKISGYTLNRMSLSSGKKVFSFVAPRVLVRGAADGNRG